MKKEPSSFYRFTDIIINSKQLMKLLKSEVVSIIKVESQPVFAGKIGDFSGYKLTCNIELSTIYANKSANRWHISLDIIAENTMVLEEYNMDKSCWIIKEFIKWPNKTKKVEK